MYEFRVLGSPRLVGPDGKEVRSVLAQRRPLALLTYLAVTSTGAYVRRDKLIGLLWAGSTDQRARASLSEALAKLRKSIDPAVISTRGVEEVGVDARVLRCDAVEFASAVATEDWSSAAAAYHGPLLDGFFLSGCNEFDSWLEHERAHLKRTAVSALGRLTEKAIASGDDSARALAERAYEIDPLDGGAVRRLMRVLARDGQRDAALCVYDMYALGIGNERGIKPSPETVELAQGIREGLLAGRARADEPIRSVDPQAFILCLRGDYELEKATEPAFEQALDHYQQAIAVDARFAPAHAGLAVSLLELGSWAGSMPAQAIHARAAAAALEAIKLDPALAEAHIALGRIKHLLEWDWEEAEASFRRGIALNPSAAYARILYSDYLVSMGRFEEAVAVARRTAQLAPLAAAACTQLGWALEHVGNHAEALEQYEHASRAEPAWFLPLVRSAGLHLRRGDLLRAGRQAQRAQELPGLARSAGYLVHLGYVLARVGRKSDTERILEELEVRAESSYVSPAILAGLYLALGKRESALTLYEEAHASRDAVCVWFKVHWHGDPLRDEPRFMTLIHQMGFPAV